MNVWQSLLLDLLHALAIVFVCILFAVVYGILHDQITARICVEYFTIGHPPVFATENPTLLGIGWGIIATWWVGFFMGVPLALAARVGRHAKRTAVTLAKPLATLMTTAGVCAIVAGLAGYLLASNGLVSLVGPLATAVPAEKHVAFLTDGFAHSASYLVGFFGGLILIAWVWWSRGREAAGTRSRAGNVTSA